MSEDNIENSGVRGVLGRLGFGSEVMKFIVEDWGKMMKLSE